MSDNLVKACANAAEKLVPKSGPAVTFVLSNVVPLVEGMKDSLKKILPLTSDANGEIQGVLSSLPDISKPSDIINGFAKTAKSPLIKETVHSGLELAAKQPQVVAKAADGVCPGSGVIVLPLLKAYNIPVVKQIMNAIVDRQINLQINTFANTLKSVIPGPK